MTFKKMFEIANSGESCIFVFPDSDTARKYMDFVTFQRPILHYEHEVYRCGSTQICYEHGDCTGTSVTGYQNYQSPPLSFLLLFFNVAGENKRFINHRTISIQVQISAHNIRW